MIKKYVETDENNIVINFLNNVKEGFKEVQIPEQWNEAFCTRTTDFKLEQDEKGNSIIKPKSTLIIATWEEFNTVKPMIDEVKQENEKLQTALDESDSKYRGLLNKVQEAEQTGEELGSLVVELQSQIEDLKGGNK